MGDEVQRVVVGVEYVEAVDAQVPGEFLEGAEVEREVLERHVRVEQLALPGEALDVAEADVLVRHQVPVLGLRVDQRDGRIPAQPHRHSVDEHADHAFDAGQFRRAAGHDGAEHHVVAAGQRPEQQRPGAVYGGAVSQVAGAQPGG